jgi:hypothetical protein
MDPTFLAATLPGATAIADQKPIQIGPPQPVVTPDSVKADRERFERDYRQNTKRPRDGMHLKRPAVPETTPSPKANEQ